MNFTIKDLMKACEKSGLKQNTVFDIIANLPKIRTSKENSSLHVLFENIAYELNELGHTFSYDGIKGMKLECKYTSFIVKEFIWRPLQNTILQKTSTTKLTNEDEKLIFVTLEEYFAKLGVELLWPSKSIEYKKYADKRKRNDL